MTERARRLLALLGTFERDTSVPLDTLSGMLDISVAEVTEDLELLSMCGVAPYGPEDLVPIFVEDGAVHVFGGIPALDRRVRLSPAETRALATALEIAGRSSSDPLVERLLAATSEADSRDLERRVHAATTGDFSTTALLASAAARRECVHIDYRAGGNDEGSERTIEPVALFNERGSWYVEAFCRRAGSLRTFRVDRIRHAEATGEEFEPREIALRGTAMPADWLPSARILFAPGVSVPEREWPGSRIVSEDEDGTLVEVPFAGTAWIAREVVSYLGAARVLDPPEVRDAVATLAAREHAARH